MQQVVEFCCRELVASLDVQRASVGKFVLFGDAGWRQGIGLCVSRFRRALCEHRFSVFLSRGKTFKGERFVFLSLCVLIACEGSVI